jgi:hypothetical protein
LQAIFLVKNAWLESCESTCVKTRVYHKGVFIPENKKHKRQTFVVKKLVYTPPFIKGFLDFQWLGLVTGAFVEAPFLFTPILVLSLILIQLFSSK